MLDRCRLRARTTERTEASWIGDQIERYAWSMQERGYSTLTIYGRILLLLQFGEFALSHGARSLSALPRLIDRFARESVHGPGGSVSKAERLARFSRPARQMLELVAPELAVTWCEERRRVPFVRAAPGFFEFLREERGLRPGSIEGYRYHLGDLEAFLRGRASRLRSIGPAALNDFVIESSKRLGKGSLSNRCGAVRVFLRYLYREQVTSRELSVTVERPRQYRLSHVPRAITWKDVRRVLARVDRRSPVGKRDYAILLLLVAYGLRAREVAALALDDVDWRRNRLHVPARKADHSSVYPLSTVVGEALLAYLQHGRPASEDRHVFLRGLAPRGPIGHHAVSLLATRHLHEAGITIAKAGSHTFRHTCVQRLVDADFSLKAIGDYVGHRSPQSTEIYAKVALEPLRQIAVDSEEAIL